MNSPFYIVSGVDGSARRLGDVMGHGGGWSADGGIIFVKGFDIYRVEPDGSHARRLATVPARAWRPRSSPDGKLIRFSIQSDAGVALWELGADGTGLHQLLAGWSSPARNGVTGRPMRSTFCSAPNTVVPRTSGP